MSQIKKFLFTIKSEGLLMFLWVIEWKISLTCNKYFECQLYAWQASSSEGLQGDENPFYVRPFSEYFAHGR